MSFRGKAHPDEPSASAPRNSAAVKATFIKRVRTCQVRSDPGRGLRHCIPTAAQEGRETREKWLVRGDSQRAEHCSLQAGNGAK